MGVRNTLRRKRRTAATIAQVTVAVALAIALFALGKTVAATTAAVHAAQQFQIEVDAGIGRSAVRRSEPSASPPPRRE